MISRLIESWQRFTLRTQMLIAVNGTLIIAAGALLAVDYHNQWTNRLQAKHAALLREAETLLPAIKILQAQGVEAVQNHIDEICDRMEGPFAPHHHIVVSLGDTVIQAHSHQRASPHMLEVVQLATGGPELVPHSESQYLVAKAQDNESKAFVIDTLDDVVLALREQLLWRSGGLAVVLLAVAGAVNGVLLWLVNRPLDAVTATLRTIAGADFGEQINVSSNADLAYLADEVNAMSAQLAESHREREQQLSKARRIQQHLLPRQSSIPSLNLAAHHQAADGVAGDYYDFIEQPQGIWWMCVVDVTGHGVPAAMEAAQLKVLLLPSIQNTADPGSALAWINERFTTVSLPEDFATVWLARWDTQLGRLDYASAGHEPGYVLRHDGSGEEASSTGLVLGIRQGESWETRAIPIEPGDRLLMCTDGLTEARSPEGAMFGADRLFEVLRASQSMAPDRALEHLLECVQEHRGGAEATDDVTCILVENSA